MTLKEQNLVTGLMYDSTGSHLVEIVVQHAPGKVFKKLFKSVWSPRLASMAKNDVASYVARKIMERLGKDDLANARDVLIQQLPALTRTTSVSNSSDIGGSMRGSRYGSSTDG